MGLSAVATDIAVSAIIRDKEYQIGFLLRLRPCQENHEC
jgi:hypothetical protein